MQTNSFSRKYRRSVVHNELRRLNKALNKILIVKKLVWWDLICWAQCFLSDWEAWRDSSDWSELIEHGDQRGVAGEPDRHHHLRGGRGDSNNNTSHTAHQIYQRNIRKHTEGNHLDICCWERSLLSVGIGVPSLKVSGEICRRAR